MPSPACPATPRLEDWPKATLYSSLTHLAAKWGSTPISPRFRKRPSIPAAGLPCRQRGRNATSLNTHVGCNGSLPANPTSPSLRTALYQSRQIRQQAMIRTKPVSSALKPSIMDSSLRSVSFSPLGHRFVDASSSARNQHLRAVMDAPPLTDSVIRFGNLVFPSRGSRPALRPVLLHVQ